MSKIYGSKKSRLGLPDVTGGTAVQTVGVTASGDLFVEFSDKNVVDLDSGSGTDYHLAAAIVGAASGGHALAPVDATYGLAVDVKRGASDTSKTDDTAFAAATDKVCLIGASNTTDTVDAGDSGSLSMTTLRELKVVLNDAAGNARGVNVDANNRLGVTLASAGTPGSAAPSTANLMGGSDGTNLRSLKTDSGGQVLITKSDLFPGEDSGNDWVKTKTAAILTYSPAKTTTASVAYNASESDLIGSTELLGYKNVAFYVKAGTQTGDASLADIKILASPDNSTWLAVTTPTTATTGTMVIMTIANNPYRYLKVSCDGAGSSGAIANTDCWLTANA